MQNEGDLLVTEFVTLKGLIEGMGCPTLENYRQLISDADLALTILDRLGESIHGTVLTRRDRAVTSCVRALSSNTSSPEAEAAMADAFATLQNELAKTARDAKRTLPQKLDTLVSEGYLMPHQAEACKVALGTIGINIGSTQAVFGSRAS